MDGIQRRPDGSLIAAFTEEETAVMVREIQRLGRKAVVHAIGREATLYAARAGVDLIFHAYDLDDECIDAMLKGGSAVAPTLTFHLNGFTPAEALIAATRTNARFLADSERVGTLEPGRCADFIALDGSPLETISVLLDKSRIHAVHLGGKRMALPARDYDPREVTDASLANWSDVYTQARVAELRRDKPLRRAAE
jgi:imidazolonepropionase-like amidohydrolase